MRKSGAPGGKSCGWRCRAAIWAQVTGQIWPPGPDGTSESLRRARCLARAPSQISPCKNRLASLLCAIAASQGQKLRLGGDALGAGPTYLLYLPSRSRGGLRRIYFGAWPRTAVSPRQIPPESTCKPLLHTRGISRAKSFDLEVTPWAPARLTSCTFHPGPAEASGAPTLEPGPAQQFRRVKFPPNRPASLYCTLAAFPGPKASTWR